METSAQSSIPPQVALARADPFSLERFTHVWKYGDSCANILLAVQPDLSAWEYTRITINGMVVNREYWHRVFPKEGAEVLITCQPRGGDVFRTLAIIALAVAAPYAGGALAFVAGGTTTALGASIAVGVATAAVFGVGMLAINALLPPDIPKFTDGENVSQALSVGGARNQFQPFGVKPVPLGRIKTYPYYAAEPVTESQGDDQYITMLLVVGGHNLEIEGLKIGNTAIDIFDEVDYELDTGGSLDTGPITLYDNTVNEQQVGILLRNNGKEPPVLVYGVATTEPGTESIIYDIAFPQGLVKLEPDGDRRTINVTVQVEYSPDGINWYFLDSHQFSARSSKAIRRGFKKNLTGLAQYPSNGQVTIRMWRTTKDFHEQSPKLNSEWVDDCYFAILRSLISAQPVNDPNAGLLAVRIKASDQLQGTPDEVNMIATSIIPVWNGADWNTLEPSNNPAAIARWVLTGESNPRPLDESRLDDTNFQTWYEFCETKKFYYNKVIDYNVTVWELFTEVCHAGRARPLQIDGLYTVRVDDVQSVPLQVFSPRNSWGFSGLKMFPDRPHALRVRYIDSRGDFQSEEMIVYANGYNSSNATLFEAVEFQGVTDWDHLWSMARYYLASIELQPESFSFSCDIENLAVLPSDRIEYQDDCILVGLGAARVKAITDTLVTLDDAVQMEAGKSYSIQFRHKDLLTITVPVDTVATNGTQELTFTGAPIAIPAEVQDLAVFGESGKIAIPLLVKNIRPGRDLSATLECIPYSDGLYTADSGAIPKYDPLITAPPGSTIPSIIQVRSDESVMTLDSSGNWQVRILCELGFPGNRAGVETILIQVRDWQAGTNITVPWVTDQILPGDAKEFSLFGWQGGDEVQIRARYVFNTGLSSEWTEWLEPDGDQFHTVVGKLGLPPVPENLNVSVMSDGTRFYTYSYDDETIIPPDFFGVLLRYVDTDLLDGSPIDFELVDGESFDLVDGVDTFDLVQTNLTAQWETMTPLRVGRITEGGYEANEPGQGNWIFAIKAVDTGGRQSALATYTNVIPLPIPRKGNNAAYRAEWPNYWGQFEVPSATLTDCYFSDPNTGGDGFLHANPLVTNWSDMPTWSTNPTWQSGFVSSCTFQQDNDFWDFGAPVTLTWSLRWTADTGVTAEIIVDGAAPVAWVDGNPYTGTTFAFKLTIAGPGDIAIREFIQEAFNSAG